MVNVGDIDFNKGDGLVPCIVQDHKTKDVLMLAYMNKEALELSISTRKATFFSRSRQEIWVKGESHDTYLPVEDIVCDCDGDTLLMYVRCSIFYNVCHTGQRTCFGKRHFSLEYLEQYINESKNLHYTQTLLNMPARCAQKVGEEAVETVIEAISKNKQGVIYESADLLYHLLVLLKVNEVTLEEVTRELERRHIM